MGHARTAKPGRGQPLRYAETVRRWGGFQRTAPAVPDALPNRDGTIPKPVVAAPTPEQVARFALREQRRAVFASRAYKDLRVAYERKIGATLDFEDLPPNQQALKAGRPVARIVQLRAGVEPAGFATGFLVHQRLLITNWHVLRTADEARGVGAQFLYEQVQDGVRSGVIFELDPELFYVADRALDYAVVGVKPVSATGAELAQFRFLPLIEVKGKILKGDPVNIIQHPDGGPKRYATVNNRLIDIRDDGFLLYETDTLEGSSGSPVFNRHWEVIAVHRSGVPAIEQGRLVTVTGRRLPLEAEVADADLVWIGNEGTRISAIVASLQQQRPDGAGQPALLEKLLETTADPLVVVEQMSPLVPGAAAAPAATGAATVFNVTGPVTVHVGAGAAVVTSAAKVAAAEPGEGFRERKLKFDEDYTASGTRAGYEPRFLSGWHVPLPTLSAARAKEALKRRGRPWVIPYHHYSLVMHAHRRLLLYAAANVDYSPAARAHTKTRKQYGGEDWRPDPRVAQAAPGLQLEDAHFYAPAKKIDRGHIVRREDAAWGATAEEAEFGNSDTYHWTNCTPQHEAFNQAGENGLWGKFEEHAEREVKALDGRMTVFAGPVLNPDDEEHGYDDAHTIQVPMEYWKVVLCTAEEGGRVRRFAYGLVFDQTEPIREFGYERMDLEAYSMWQVPLAEIAQKTGVRFDRSVLAADVLKDAGRPESRAPGGRLRVRELESLVLR